MYSYDVYGPTRLDMHPLWRRVTPSLDLVVSPPTERFAAILDLQSSTQAATGDNDGYAMFYYYRVAARTVALMRISIPLVEVGASRLDVQSGLLRFPKLDEVEEPNLSDVLLSVCRTTGLIFSDMVLYTFLYSSGIKPRLSGQLHEAFELLTQFFLNDEQHEASLAKFSDLLIWSCTLGAIAGARVPHLRLYYLNQLRSHPHQTKQWITYNALLSQFLWYEPVCEPLAYSLWKEINEPILT